MAQLRQATATTDNRLQDRDFCLVVSLGRGFGETAQLIFAHERASDTRDFSSLVQDLIANAGVL